ncbi:MAG: zinc-ribbon domain-containing protein [Dissulfuribacterales bacterium]
MEITCSDCGQRYRVDDSKIPESGFTYITCPRCKGKIRLENTLYAIQPHQAADTVTGKLEEGFDTGVKTALIYTEDKEFGKGLRNKLAGLSYEIRDISTPVDLTVRFRYHTYDLIILQQKGNTLTQPMTALLQAVHKLPADVRRATIACMFTPDGSRLDSFKAFLYGVDLVLSPTELEQLDRIILKAASDKQDRYKIFYDCRQKMAENMI